MLRHPLISALAAAAIAGSACSGDDDGGAGGGEGEERADEGEERADEGEERADGGEDAAGGEDERDEGMELCARAFERALHLAVDDAGGDFPEVSDAHKARQIRLCMEAFDAEPGLVRAHLDCMIDADELGDMDECPSIDDALERAADSLIPSRGVGCRDAIGAKVDIWLEEERDDEGETGGPLDDYAQLLEQQSTEMLRRCELAREAHPEETEAFIECAADAEVAEDLDACPDLPDPS